MAALAGMKIFKKLIEKYGPTKAAKKLRTSGIYSDAELRAIIAKYNKPKAAARRASRDFKGGKRAEMDKRLQRLRQKSTTKSPETRKYYRKPGHKFVGKDVGGKLETGPGFDKALNQRIRNLKRTGVDAPVPIGKPKVRERLERKAQGYKKLQDRYKGAERDALRSLDKRNLKLKAEVTKALRGYTPGSTPQTAEIRQKKGLVIRMLQKMGFMNPRGQGGRGMANQRHWDEVGE